MSRKTELSSISLRSGCSSIKISGDISFATKKRQQNGLQKHFLRGDKKLAPSYLMVALATPCHPMATVRGIGLTMPVLRAETGSQKQDAAV